VGTVSVRMSEKLEKRIEDLVEEGLFKNKTEAIQEGVRTLLLKYEKLD